MLDIVSVVFKNSELFAINQAITERLNPTTPHRWIVADNELGENQHLRNDNLTLVDGAVKRPAGDAGSLHHAEGIHNCLSRVTARYVLLIDPDFYVIRPEWIADVLSHMETHQLSFFGSVWHPRWYYQYRYFPTVHFMLIDLQRAPLETLDFRPLIEKDRVWHWLNQGHIYFPDAIRLTLKICRIRDTGWQIYKRYVEKPGHQHEALIPSYQPPQNARTAFEEKFGGWLWPDRFCFTPQREGYFTQESFLSSMSPTAWEQGWEEFYWQGSPFAFHLRNVGRKSDSESELPLLRKTLEAFGVSPEKGPAG